MPKIINFDSQPEKLPFEVEEVERPAHFDPKQHRAFGSLPRLIGGELTIPRFDQLDSRAWELTDAATMRQGLYGERGAYTVNNLAVSPEYYEQIIRNQEAFLSSIGAKALAANRMVHPERLKEKYDKSQVEPLRTKLERHKTIMNSLDTQQENVDTLLEWQRQPGYWRTNETELRVLGTSVWDQTLLAMLATLRDNYNLSVNDHINMQQALSYRLFRGSQSDRIKQWGQQLSLGHDYTRSLRLQFQQSRSKIEKQLDKLS